MKPYFRFICTICLVVITLTACSALNNAPTNALTKAPTAQDPTEAARRTLSSIKKVNDFPLYTMSFYSDYDDLAMSLPPGQSSEVLVSNSAWGCSLFAALGDQNNQLYGRNFDWEFSPALLLFTHPANGYDSVSMVDLTYLVDVKDANRLTELSPEERQPLLKTPLLPFDGMNEAGLAIGMAAVPAGNKSPDPGKVTIGSIRVIREVLDHAGNVDEAETIFKKYNLNWGGGPTMHYLIADRSGKAILVEFSGSEMVVIRNTSPWLVATNFLVDQAGNDPEAMCPRYQKVSQRLTGTNGRLTVTEGMQLLSQVAQGGPSATQWSVVYNISTGEVNVVVGQQYDKAVFKASIGDSPD